MMTFQYQRSKQRQLRPLQGIKLPLNCGFDFVLVELQHLKLKLHVALIQNNHHRASSKECAILSHTNFHQKPLPGDVIMRNLHDTGLFINPSVPFLGASPDGFVSCDCCGVGVSVIEVKCPFCVKSDKLDSVSYLEEDSEGKLTLNRNHQYFYQVQTQLGVCKLESAHFVVWTEKDLHVEQISFDEEFWGMICQKSKNIFDTAIMPELVGKFYTRLLSTMATVSSQPGIFASAESHGSDCAASASDQEKTWCFCGQVEFGKMILCENAKCHIKWFHYSCVNVKIATKGKMVLPTVPKATSVSAKKKERNLQSNKTMFSWLL